MWMAEAKAAIPIPLMGRFAHNVDEWDNSTLREFIVKRQTTCKDFTEALAWLGDRSAKQALAECKNDTWKNWLLDNIRLLPDQYRPFIIEKGKTITITHGRDEKFALWHHTGIWDLSEEYVTDIDVRVTA